jgi:hypothetical protein
MQCPGGAGALVREDGGPKGRSVLASRGGVPLLIGLGPSARHRRLVRSHSPLAVTSLGALSAGSGCPDMDVSWLGRGPGLIGGIDTGRVRGSTALAAL